jgi:RNA polymerase sigma factor (sigma-70 family)
MLNHDHFSLCHVEVGLKRENRRKLSIREIVTGCQERQDCYLKDLMNQYFNMIHRYFSRFCARSEELEELCYDFFADVWESIERFNFDPNLPEYEMEEHFKNWLFMIANWKKGEFIRSKKSRKGQFETNIKTFNPQESFYLSQEMLNGGENSADSLLIHKENEKLVELKNTALNTFLAFLPPDDRELVVLRYCEGRTYKEIAKIVGAKNPTTLRKKTERAIKKLKEHIKTSTIDSYFLRKRRNPQLSIHSFLQEHPLRDDTGGLLKTALKEEEYWRDLFCSCNRKFLKKRFPNTSLLKLLVQHFVAMRTYIEIEGDPDRAIKLKRKVQKAISQLEHCIAREEEVYEKA